MDSLSYFSWQAAVSGQVHGVGVPRKKRTRPHTKTNRRRRRRRRRWRKTIESIALDAWVAIVFVNVMESILLQEEENEVTRKSKMAVAMLVVMLLLQVSRDSIKRIRA